MTDDRPVVVDDVREAIGLLEIRNVHAIELHGRRRDAELEGVPPSDEQLEVDPNFGLHAQENQNLFAVRMRGDFANTKVLVTADVAIVYEKAKAFTLDESIQGELIRVLALPNLYPFVRQYVQDTSAKLGAPLVPGLIRIGDHSVQVNGRAEADTGDGFLDDSPAD